MDPHGPYYPADPDFRGKFRPAPPGVKLQLGKNSMGLGDIPHYQKLTDNGRTVLDANQYIAEYDAEIAYTDHSLQPLFEALREQGFARNTAVVLTSDHGESMGTHTLWFEHGIAVFQETVRLPLLIHIPGRQGHHLRGFFRAIDLPPSLLSLFGLRFQEDTDGRDLSSRFLRGRSLPVSTTHGEARIDWHFNTKFIARDGWKLTHCYDTGGTLLHDLARDPDEINNLAAAEPRRLQRMKRELDAWVKERDHLHRHETPVMDEETKKEMRALGYLH